MILGQPAHITLTLRNAKGELSDAEGALTLKITAPGGKQDIYKIGAGEIVRDSLGEYHMDVATTEPGGWHYKWVDSAQAVAEGTWDVETEERAAEAPDLTDLRVLVPRARRKVEGPWGNPNNRPRLTDDEIYALVADAVSEVILLSGSFFEHELRVKSRDVLGGYAVEWQTDVVLEEYEAAIVAAQVALNYYFHVFNNMRISESIKNEGTEWTYSLSANVVRSYLQSIIDERDKAIAALRAHHPVIDRFASNIRVRDQATVAVLEWWDINSPGLAGGQLPGGQEATTVPWFPSGEQGIP